MAVRGKNYQPQDYEIRQMWAGGPSRIWSSTCGNMAPMGYATGGFVGSYICQGCNQQADGVYRSEDSTGGKKWLCGSCADRSAKAENEGVAVEDVDVPVVA
jgi:hypothetical protein